MECTGQLGSLDKQDAKNRLQTGTWTSDPGKNPRTVKDQLREGAAIFFRRRAAVCETHFRVLTLPPPGCVVFTNQPVRLWGIISGRNVKALPGARLPELLDYDPSVLHSIGPKGHTVYSDGRLACNAAESSMSVTQTAQRLVALELTR